MKVLSGNVLIKADEVEKSIIITEDTTELSDRATVVAVGDEVSKVKVNDRIFFNNRAGRFIQIDDEEYLLIHISDIFIIL